MTRDLTEALMRSLHSLRSLLPNALLVASAVVATTAHAQTIDVYVGTTERITAAPGSKLRVPIGVDISAAGSLALASVQIRLNWDPATLVLDSIRPIAGTGLEYNINEADRLTGQAALSAYSTAAFTGSMAIAEAFYSSFPLYGGPRIIATTQAAGAEFGTNITANVRTRGLDVCLVAVKRWGDVTDDDAVNIIDAQQLARATVGLSVLNATALAARGDVTEDATVNILDAQQVARHSVGLSTTGRVAGEIQTIPTVSSLTNSLGATYQLPSTAGFRVDPIARDASGRDVTGCYPFTWTSDNPTAISVNSQGAVTVRSPGIATLQAVGAGRSTSVTVLPILTSTDPWTIANDALRNWYLAATHLEPYHALQVTADATTSNFANFGMRWNNTEPRIAYDNTTLDVQVALRPWNGNYTVLNQARTALAYLDRGFGTTGGADEIRAVALFAQAAALSNLAMLFDRALPITDNSATDPALTSYENMRALAVSKWQDFLAFTNGKSFTLPSATLPSPTPMTVSMLRRIANTMAARTLVLSARTASENTATNWSQVLAFANQGLTGDGLSDANFEVISDNTNWFSYITLHGNLSSWIRTDTRLINRMAPNIPVTFTGTLTVPTPTDLRLGTTSGANADYVYLGFVIGDPARGIYMQSPFFHKRYAHLALGAPGVVGGASPYIIAAENDLMIAEALARTGGDLSRAATLVNKTRVTRGGLSPLTAGSGAEAILSAIEYEREVELQNTNGLALFDRRRLDALQTGTFRHLPIPSSVAPTLGLAPYTFGGVGLPDK